jgi:hypothetical protein
MGWRSSSPVASIIGSFAPPSSTTPRAEARTADLLRSRPLRSGRPVSSDTSSARHACRPSTALKRVTRRADRPPADGSPNEVQRPGEPTRDGTLSKVSSTFRRASRQSVPTRQSGPVSTALLPKRHAVARPLPPWAWIHVERRMVVPRGHFEVPQAEAAALPGGRARVGAQGQIVVHAATDLG